MQPRKSTFAVLFFIKRKKLLKNGDALYKLEQAIISLVKVNRQIVSLANDFDAYWREKDMD